MNNHTANPSNSVTDLELDLDLMVDIDADVDKENQDHGVGVGFGGDADQAQGQGATATIGCGSAGGAGAGGVSGSSAAAAASSSMMSVPVLCVSEIIKDRLYFATTKGKCTMESTPIREYFSIEDELTYTSFNADFGPLNLAMLYKYCQKLEAKLQASSAEGKRLIHYTSNDNKKRVNAAFLMGAYSIIYLNKSSDEAYRSLQGPGAFIHFKDASLKNTPTSSPYISLEDVLSGLEKAKQNKFFDFEDFDIKEYEYYERVEKADLNWLVPEKFIAFCGPNANGKRMLDLKHSYPAHAPEVYFKYFRKNNVESVVRLNGNKFYDLREFTTAGFKHKDLYFPDGATPSPTILKSFLDLAEETSGAVAVHCKSGLGRTGVLICSYIVKHYNFSAREAIAWVRLCRPGSVLGMQQAWLEANEGFLKMEGDLMRAKFENGNAAAKIHKFQWPIYSIKRKQGRSTPTSTPSGAAAMEMDSQDANIKLASADQITKATDDEITKEEGINGGGDSYEVTQGDILNHIKATRLKNLNL